MVTSWLLVMAMQYDRSASVTVVPNLSTSAECFRVAESINKFAPKQMPFKCVEVYNAEPRK